MKKLLVIVAAAFALAGCTEVPTGSVALQKSWTGYISPSVVGQGLHLNFFKSYYPIDTTLTRASVANMQPKDRHGVALKDVSVVVSYRLDPTRVAAFYRQSKEIDQEPDSDLYTLGLAILQESVIPYAVQIATERSDLATISSNLGDYANTIQAVMNKRLEQLYPGIDPFVIQSVTIQTFDLPSAIQNQMNAKAGYKAELQTLAAKMAVVQQLKAIKVAQASINADALATAAKTSGLSPDQVIAWKRAQALSALAKTGKTGVLVSTK